MKLRNFFINLFLCLSSILFLIISLEIYLRLTKHDVYLLKDMLYYEDSVLRKLYQSTDSKTLYNLIPNAELSIQSGDTKVRMSVNAAGFRNNFEVVPSTDKYRIVLIGGSNTFGFDVGDTETYAAFMQEAFDKKYPDKVEVINAGIPAYVATQKLAYAERIILEYKPDMLIIQNYNSGRRPFLKEDDAVFDFLYQDKELFAESIPFLFSQNYFVQTIHYRLVYTSALYRAFMSRLNLVGIVLSYNFAMEDSHTEAGLQESGELFTKSKEFSFPGKKGISNLMAFLSDMFLSVNTRDIYDVSNMTFSTFWAEIKKSDFTPKKVSIYKDPFLVFLKQALILAVAPGGGFVINVAEDKESFVNKFNMAVWRRGEQNNKKAWKEFLKKYGDKIPVMVFYPAQENNYTKNILIKREGYYRLKFALGDKSEQYTYLHPQGYVYKWYSEKMVTLLDSFVQGKEDESLINNHYIVAA